MSSTKETKLETQNRSPLCAGRKLLQPGLKSLGRCQLSPVLIQRCVTMEARKHTDSFEAIFPSKNAISAFTVEEVLRHGRPKLDDPEDPGENPGYIFRGELDYKVPLQSSLERHVLNSGVGRRPVDGERLRNEERSLIAKFMNGDGVQVARIADEEINRVQVNRTDTFRWLSLMQHYEMPTRLIDFSRDIRVALFFATWHHSRMGNSRPALVSEDLVIYCFPCFGFDDFVQNKTPITRDQSGKINMNTALCRRIGLSWAGAFSAPEIRPFPPRKFGWDRPHFQNDRLRRQKGMFVYPFDDPMAPLGLTGDSWLVGNLADEGAADPFKFGDLKKQLPGMTIRLPSAIARCVADELAVNHGLIEQALMPDIEIALRS